MNRRIYRARMIRALWAVLVGTLVLPAASHAALTYTMDFESGLGHFNANNSTAPHGVAIVTGGENGAPAAPSGAKILKSEVKAGRCQGSDVAADGSCKRYHEQITLYRGFKTWRQGEEQWLGFSLYLDRATTTSGGYFKLSDYHPESGSLPCQTNVDLRLDYPVGSTIRNGLMVAANAGGTCSTNNPRGGSRHALSPGTWHRIVLHTRFSTGSDGFHRLYVNGSSSPVSEISGATLYGCVGTQCPGTGYAKLGLYVDAATGAQEPRAYFDFIKFASTRAEVDPAVPAQPPGSSSPPPPTQFSVATVSPSDGQKVKGLIPWTVAVHGASAEKVNFFVDGALRSTDTTAPFAFGDGALWDTRSLSNGRHRLKVQGVASDGTIATASVDVKVANGTGEKLLVQRFQPIIEGECGSCAVRVVDEGVTASVEGATEQAAYGLHDFGGSEGWSGRVWTRDVVRLPHSHPVAGELSLFQVRDVDNELVYEVLAAAGGEIVFRSPDGGLSSGAIEMPTGVQLRADGGARRIEVSAEANESVRVRIDGIKRIDLADLSGASTGNQRFLRAGIMNRGLQPAGVALARHDGVGVSRVRWLGERALMQPSLRFLRRPKVGRSGWLKIRAHTVSNASVKIRVKGRGGRLLGSRTVRAGGRGNIVTAVRLRPYSGKKLRVRTRARFELYGDRASKLKAKRIRLTRTERSRLRRA